MHSHVPIKICVTGAAGQIAYSLLYPLATGELFGKDQPISLSLLDIPAAAETLHGVVMELEDGAFPILKSVSTSTDPIEAFADVDVAILVGALPRREGMERKDLLKANVAIFKAQGAALDKVAKKTVKVLVVGNPANTNAYITKHYAPSIPPENFSALTRLDQNRASAAIASKTKVSVAQVKNVIIWGNHSNTQYPDVSHATVDGKPVEELLETKYLQSEFVSFVQKRGGAVIAARKLSSAMSASKAIIDHLHSWLVGTKKDEYVSMAVVSDGSYNIPSGLMCSVPVTCSQGVWTLVKNLKINEFSKTLLDETVAELEAERKEALAFLGTN